MNKLHAQLKHILKACDTCQCLAKNLEYTTQLFRMKILFQQISRTGYHQDRKALCVTHRRPGHKVLCSYLLEQQIYCKCLGGFPCFLDHSLPRISRGTDVRPRTSLPEKRVLELAYSFHIKRNDANVESHNSLEDT